MGDDIVTRLRSENRMALAPLHMSDAADEIVRLRADAAFWEHQRERDAWRAEVSLNQAVIEEIERLRTLGDAMAEAALRQRWSSLDVAVAAWKEARRG